MTHFPISKLILFACFIFSACATDPSVEKEKQRLLAENNRLIKELADSKSENELLKKEIESLTTAADTLQKSLKKQADLESLRRRAAEKPLELPTEKFAVQNLDAKNKVLKTASPFKNASVRYISFRLNATNNLAKINQKLAGKLYAIYRLGTLVQRMESVGTFKGSDGNQYVFTKMWEISSEKDILPLDKGIGDKARGIFEKGNWTLELWFEKKGSAVAYKLGESKFSIE